MLGSRLQKSLEINSKDFQEGGKRDLGSSINDKECENIVNEYEFIYTGVLRIRINVNEHTILEQLLTLYPIVSQASQNYMYCFKVYFTVS